MIRSRLILAVALICVIAVSAFIVSNYFMAPVKPPVPAPLSLPTPPPVAGCHQYNSTEGWLKVACLPPGSIHGHSHEGGNPSSAAPGILGIGSTPSKCGDIICETLITLAQVRVSFTTYSGELDSGSKDLPGDGGGAFSIQLNTNFFTGSNGHEYWVQFTFGNACTPSCSAAGAVAAGNGVCVSNVDITTNNYANECVYETQPEVLSSGYSVTITGQILGNSSGNFVATTAALSDGQILSVALPDTYALAGEWYQASGTILGYVDGSQAIFFGPTVENT